MGATTQPVEVLSATIFTMINLKEFQEQYPTLCNRPDIEIPNDTIKAMEIVANKLRDDVACSCKDNAMIVKAIDKVAAQLEADGHPVRIFAESLKEELNL